MSSAWHRHFGHCGPFCVILLYCEWEIGPCTHWGLLDVRSESTVDGLRMNDIAIDRANWTLGQATWKVEVPRAPLSIRCNASRPLIRAPRARGSVYTTSMRGLWRPPKSSPLSTTRIRGAAMDASQYRQSTNGVREGASFGTCRDRSWNLARVWVFLVPVRPIRIRWNRMEWFSTLSPPCNSSQAAVLDRFCFLEITASVLPCTISLLGLRCPFRVLCRGSEELHEQMLGP